MSTRYFPSGHVRGNSAFENSSNPVAGADTDTIDYSARTSQVTTTLGLGDRDDGEAGEDGEPAVVLDQLEPGRQLLEHLQFCSLHTTTD